MRVFFAEEDRLLLGDHEVQLSRKFNKEASVLASEFLSYPKINLQWEASYTRDPFFGSEESVFILQSSDPWKRVEGYYLRKIDALKWQLIQHLHKNNNCLLIVETPFQRLVTFLISTNTNPMTKGKPLSVKIYSRLAAVY